MPSEAPESLLATEWGGTERGTRLKPLAWGQKEAIESKDKHFKQLPAGMYPLLATPELLHPQGYNLQIQNTKRRGGLGCVIPVTQKAENFLL